MLHYFNPGHEQAVLNSSPYYMPPANVLKMQDDLAFLPAWYAGSEDFVFVQNRISPDFLELYDKNLNLSINPVREKDFDNKKEILSNQELSCWGISPQAIHYFETVRDRYDLNLQIPAWNIAYKEWCSREKAAFCLQFLCDNLPNISHKLLPTFHTNIPSINKCLIENGTQYFVAKAPYSSSGRGLLFLPKGKLGRTQTQLLSGILNKQNTVSIEPVLDKTMDFAMEFYMNGKGIVDFCGISLFETNNKGAYSGNILTSQDNITKKIESYIDGKLLNDVQTIFTQSLLTKISSFYKGYIGVDMMIYQEKDNYFLHPCLEINLRSTMGIIAIHFVNNFLHSESNGRFTIIYANKDGDMLRFHNERQQQYPTEFTDKKLKSGYISLCPISEKTKFVAYVIA